MGATEKKVVVKVDASAFGKQVNDMVAKGELLGYYAGKPVEAPCNAKVEGVSFDSGDHVLVVVLAEASA